MSALRLGGNAKSTAAFRFDWASINACTTLLRSEPRAVRNGPSSWARLLPSFVQAVRRVLPSLRCRIAKIELATLRTIAGRRLGCRHLLLVGMDCPSAVTSPNYRVA